MWQVSEKYTKCLSRKHKSEADIWFVYVSRRLSKSPVNTGKIWVKFGVQSRMLLLLSAPVCIRSELKFQSRKHAINADFHYSFVLFARLSRVVMCIYGGFNSQSRCLLSVTGLTERHPEQSVRSMRGGRAWTLW